jgi:hypothetical protein
MIELIFIQCIYLYFFIKHTKNEKLRISIIFSCDWVAFNKLLQKLFGLGVLGKVSWFIRLEAQLQKLSFFVQVENRIFELVHGCLRFVLFVKSCTFR